MGWQPVETAPRDGTRVLLFGPFDGDAPALYVGWWDDDEDCWRASRFDLLAWLDPTHWMPLPPQPA